MKRYNMRIAGVGGQGVVTSAHILGNAMSAAGKYASLVPFFGSEKRMAPVEAYVRASDQPIYEVGEVVYPNVIMIYHPQVITHGKSYTMPFYSGLKPDGLVIINTDVDIIPEEDHAILEKLNTKVINFPATKIALDIAGYRTCHKYGYDWFILWNNETCRFRIYRTSCKRKILG
jgi:2-oxoacid:acceptor oxidoreductase, gamma subunit, pyruvate/2-ketoisovalerate family